MKKSLMFAISIAVFVLFVSGVYASTCSLSATLVNQDPYPATPDDYVKVVFQLDGVENPACGQAKFQIVPSYPFSLDSGQSDSVSVNSGTYSSSAYSSFLLAQYKLRIDKGAVDGENPINVKFAHNIGEGGIEGYQTKDFNITIKDARTDFEVSIQNYILSTNTLTFGVVNVGKKDAKAVTLDIPEQNNINVKGTSVSIIGSLNSNDDTTASFVGATPKEGEIKVNVNYNDNIGVRRTLEKTVTFTNGYAEQNGQAQQSNGASYYLLIVSWILFVIIWIFLYVRRRRRLAKEKILKKRSG